MVSRAPRLSSAVVLAVVIAVVVTGVVVDAVAGGSRTLGPRAAEVALQAGSTTCAAAAQGEGSEVTVTTVAAPTDTEDSEDESNEADTEDEGNEAGDGTVEGGAASLRLEDDGEVRTIATPPVDGGALATAVEDGTGEVAIAARWEDAPLLLSRRWSIGSTDRVPGSVEGPCPAEPASEWYVPGVATAGGAAADLHLANPTDGSASLAVTFTTPDGPVAPTRLANLAVPARGQVVVDLNEFVPEEPDLGVVVTTRAGRVVAEVVQTLESAVGGVDGRSLVVAHAQPAEIWTIPWVASGEQETSWVWVTNPGDEATDVRLVLHTDAGPVVPPASGVTLAPGTTQRIDLRGALGEAGTAGVTVRSAPGVPILASGAVLRAVEDDAERGGVAVVEAGAAGGGLRAALSATGGSDREQFLAVVNPGDVDATLDVTVTGRSPATAGVVASDVVVPAGGLVMLPLDEDVPLEGAFAVMLDVSEGAATATLVTRSAEGPLDLTASLLRPFPTTVTVTQQPVRRDRSLLHPLDRAELDAEATEAG